MATTYAAVSDVQARFRLDWFTIAVDSEPDSDQVQAWLDEYATHVDTAAGLSAETSEARDILTIKPYLSGRVAYEVVHLVRSGKNITAREQRWLDDWDKWLAALTEGDTRLPSVSGSTGRARIIPTKVYGLDS